MRLPIMEKQTLQMLTKNHSIVLIFSSTFTENVEKGRPNENNHTKINTV